MLPLALHTAWATSVSYKISGLNTFTGWGPPSSIGPHVLSVYASNWALPHSLQDSIRGGWLGPTSAGSSPACHDDLARSLVHLVVVHSCVPTHDPRTVASVSSVPRTIMTPAATPANTNIEERARAAPRRR
jgi:hypothetical protein